MVVCVFVYKSKPALQSKTASKKKPVGNSSKKSPAEHNAVSFFFQMMTVGPRWKWHKGIINSTGSFTPDTAQHVASRYRAMPDPVLNEV